MNAAPPDPLPRLLTRLRQGLQSGPISYRDYIETVLYAEHVGYYTQPRDRVGRSPRSDFYTAESLGRVFAQLVTTAAQDLLPPGQAETSTFIEIAAEPDKALLDYLPEHPFAGQRVIRQGEPINPGGPVVIFANEWLDALPFHRLIFQDGRWRERGVALGPNDSLDSVLLDEWTPPVQAAAARLPKEIEDGYELDWPLEAETVLANLLREDWTGLILLFDYGRTWESLLQDHPSGTARTYRAHAQGSDLLEDPGRRDITCDVNWTPLLAEMEAAGLRSVTLESQESFLVQRAGRAAEAIVAGSAGSFSPDRQTLMELIHPANMGQRFQVLWGLRGS